MEVLSTSTMAEKQVVKETVKGSGSNAPAAASKSNYKGFVAGVFSGIAKLSGEFCRCVPFLKVLGSTVGVLVSVLIVLNILVGHPYVIRGPSLRPSFTYRELWIECNNRWIL